MKVKHLFTTLLLMYSTIATAEEITIDGIKYDVVTKAKQATVIAGDTKYTGDIVIPNEVTHNGVVCSITTIGDRAFWDCTGLTSITIPSSVTTIGDRAFGYCTGLTSITIPNNITSISDYTFYGCTGLTSVTIGNSVTTIGDHAFWCCKGLTSITIPNNVTTIGDYAFYCCTGLTSITIPSSVTTIGDHAFEGCDGLTNITIPNSVTSIGYEAFNSCTGLTAVHINNLSAWCNINFSNQDSNPLFYAKDLYLNGKLVTELVIPYNVAEIKKYAFSYCSSFTSVTLPNSITSINGYAFYKCTGLTSITIPSSVTTIGDRAFGYCTGLTSITIPNSITSISDYTFAGCTGLTSITIPSSVTAIYSGAFENCTGLTNITIPSSVTAIYSGAFENCTRLTSITIPSSVTEINNYAFENCTGLTSATIGKGVKSLGARAFANCENLTEVYCLATIVPYANETAFENSYPEYMTLHIPAEAIESYRKTAPWSSFGTIKSLSGEEIPEVEVKKCATPVINYKNGKLSITCETDGAEFITKIEDSDIATHYNNEIELSATYEVTTYAMLSGYENSDVASATLCWLEGVLTEDGTNNVINVGSTPVLIKANEGIVTLTGVKNNTIIAVYDTNGYEAGNAVATGNEVTIATTLTKGEIAVVSIGGEAVKVIMK